MDKEIFKNSDIKDRIIAGIDFIVNPVASTLGPKGNNVLFENDSGGMTLTNDGVTIAKNVSSSDSVQEMVIETIKSAALRTNSEGGDGTTSTTTLSGVLTKEAMKLVEDGYSWIQVRDELDKLAEKLIKKLEKSKITVEGKKGLREIATISSNNDPEVAENVMKAIDVAKEDGMIFLDGSNKAETEIVQDLGFMVKSGIPYQELLVDSGKNTVVFKDAPVLLTDKKIYYAEEAETILRVALKAGHKSVVIVARDFIGDAVNTFIANHTKGVIKVMLVRAEGVDEKSSERLQDLAIYLGGTIVTEKTGSLVNKLTPEQFVMVKQAFSDPQKTLFTPTIATSKKLKERIAMLKEELAKNKDNEDVKHRLASLTTGVVTIKVGGATSIDMREKVFRYEDAINATRSAMKYGYLIGGGTAMLKAFDAKDCTNNDFLPLYRKYCEAITRQIAVNAGKHDDTVVANVLTGGATHGYNARTDKYEDMLKAGIVDPFMVVKLSIEGSMATAKTLVSVKYYMVIDKKENGKED